MIKLVKRLMALPLSLIAFLGNASLALAVTHTPTPAAAEAGKTVPFEVPKQFLTGVSVEKLPQFLITLLFLVGIVIAVVFLIYGGIKWILSGGDSKQVEGARNHIVAAIVGLIVVVGAFFILNFVFQLLTGQPFSFTDICISNLKSGGTCPQATLLP